MAQQTSSKVRIIEPTLTMFGSLRADIQALIDACAYARVSTDKDEQEMSFERQYEYYESYIRSQPNLKFIKMYSDLGLSATRAEKRPGFLSMIEDAKAGKIKKIFCKAVSRFARNTVDALFYIRQLREIGVSIYFETERVDTLTPGGDLLITFLAGQAEQESRSISKAVEWAYKRKFESGEIHMPKSVLGYTKDAEKNIIIEPTEAKIVQRIFKEFIAGNPTTVIAKQLEAEGILTPGGKKHWTRTTILRMIQNKSYTGNSIMGKSYKVDVTSKNRVKNKGERRLYDIQNSHPAIISMEVFDLAQAECVKRTSLRSHSATGKGRYSGMYAFSGKLVCGCCGSKLRRWIQGYYAGATKRAAWICQNRQINRNCDAKRLTYEEAVETAFISVMNELAGNHQEFVAALKENITAEISDDRLIEIDKIERKILAIQESVLQLHKDNRAGLVSASDYEQKINQAEKDIAALRNKKAELELKNEQVKLIKYRIESIGEMLNGGLFMEGFNDQIFNDLIEDVIIHKDRYEFNFKCGLKMPYNLN